MKYLIVYRSKHGTSQKVALLIKNHLEGNEVDCFNLADDETVSPENYDAVIVGGSIHYGHIQEEVFNFCSTHEEVLLNKKLGLFICFMNSDLATEAYNNSFSSALRAHASAKGLFGGELLFNKMNLAEKIICKIIRKASSSSHLKTREIVKFISLLNNNHLKKINHSSA